MEHEPKRPMKSCMPRIAKTVCTAKTTKKTLPTAGSAFTSEETITFIPSMRDTKRSGRNARRMRIECSGPDASSRSTTVTTTMKKSS